MIRHICFDCSTFKIIIKDGTGDNIVYCCIYITSYSCWLIFCWYDAKFKHKINKMLDFFIVFIIEDIDIKITCKEKCFVSCPIWEKNFRKRFQLYLGLYQVDLYTILIIMFLEWSLIISLDRDSISLQFILRSTRILCRSESWMNIAFPPPLLFFLIWCTGLYPSSWNNKFFLRLLSLVLV